MKLRQFDLFLLKIVLSLNVAEISNTSHAFNVLPRVTKIGQKYPY